MKLSASVYTRGLTAAEVTAVQETMYYDRNAGRVKWKPRTPAMFPRNHKPEDTCEGWNRAHQHMPVITRAETPKSAHWGRVDFRYMGERYSVHSNDIHRLLVGQDLPVPEHVQRRVRGQRGDPEVLRLLFKKGALITWAPIDFESYVEVLVATRGWSREFARGPAGRKSYMLHVSKKCGKPVGALRTGMVKVSDEYSVHWNGICDALGAVRVMQSVMEHPLKVVKRPKIPDFVLRMLMERDRSVDWPYALKWKARDGGVWDALVMGGVVEKMPNAAAQAVWNVRFAGKYVWGRGKNQPTGLTAGSAIRIGVSSVLASRVVSVLDGI